MSRVQVLAISGVLAALALAGMAWGDLPVEVGGPVVTAAVVGCAAKLSKAPE